ncbi:MAG: methyltransferase domain-containing protein [Stackebrandtia sp.]
MATSAGSYTHGHHASVLRSHKWRTAQNSAAYLLPHLKPGMSLLDVGCGPGAITADLARRLAPGRVTAIDAAEDVLAEARTAASSVPNVEFAAADVRALDFDDNAFDVVHAHQVLQHLDDPVRALREMRRVCRPGGIVAARDSDYAAMYWHPDSPELEEWRRLYRRIAVDNGGQPDAGRRLLSWARAAGFSDVTTTATTWCFATPPDRSWWSQMWAERIRRSGIAEQALRDSHASADDLERLAVGWRRWGAAPDGCFVVPHTEIVCRAPDSD